MIEQLIEEQLDFNALRKEIFHSSRPGYVVLKDFVKSEQLDKIRRFWLDPNLSNNFYQFIKNGDVGFGTPNYLYNKPTPDDFAYCCFLWNVPPCQLTHQLAFSIQQIRNKVEGKPSYSGLTPVDGWVLQYRVCNARSEETIVYPHGDFIEQYRCDPTGSHEFDPSRIQATLLLATKGEDYDGEGFIYTSNQGDKITFDEMGAKAGDLILWRYGNLHEVKEVKVNENQIGFMRVIYPMFDLKIELNTEKLGHEVEYVGMVNNHRIYKELLDDNT